MLAWLRNYLYRRQFLRFTQYAKGKKIIFFCDFDNTLADTLLSRINGSFHDVANYAPLNGSIDYLVNQKNIVILSARDIKRYLPVQKWLTRHINNEFCLFFVPSAQAKMKYYEHCLNEDIEIIVMDDCSYGESFSDLMFYEESIDYFENRKIQHLDFDYIKNLNQ